MPKNRLAKFAATAALLTLTAACSSTTVVPAASAIDYRQFQSIRFNAAQVQVINDYQPRGSAPNIDHLMDQNPAQAVTQWANANLRANGGNGYVQVHIKDASVVSQQLGKIGGVEGYFTKQQGEQLVAHVSVEIDGDQSDLRFHGYTTVEASQLLTVPEDATVTQRKAIEQQLVNKLMTQFISRAQAGILDHLHPMMMP